MAHSDFVHYSLLQSSLLWFHITLFVFWVGADMGVYIAHFYILDRNLSLETRLVAAKILRAVDFFPRISMSLFLASGVALISMNPLGEPFRGWPLALVLIASAIWAAATIFLFIRSGGPVRGGERFGHFVEKGDKYGKVVVVAILALIGLYVLFADTPFGAESNPKWLGIKVLLYAGAIASAVGMEMSLAPFNAAFVELLTVGSSEDVEKRLHDGLIKCRPWAYAIWITVACAAFVGLWKPGSTY